MFARIKKELKNASNCFLVGATCGEAFRDSVQPISYFSMRITYVFSSFWKSIMGQLVPLYFVLVIR
jgi:hypothetical protein